MEKHKINLEYVLEELNEHTANAGSIYNHFLSLYMKKHFREFFDASEATHKAVLEWYDRRNVVFDRYAHMVYINNSKSWGL